ncbi:MAG: hypothetical protein KDC03_05915, partial [Flavobacteriales bacterium]|nr:hypothetical protein [Flavobacteriales bacterium]
FLRKLNIEPRASFYTPCTNISIIRRQLNNLGHSYAKLGDRERAADMEALREVLAPFDEQG